MGLGVPALAVGLWALMWVLMLWAVVDAALKPMPAWQAIGRSKTAWLVALIASFIVFPMPIGLPFVPFVFLPFGLIISLVYLLWLRPQLSNHGRDWLGAGR